MTAHAMPLPDLSGRRALVTGASAGIGIEIAAALAAAGAALVLPVRNPQRGTAAAASIAARTPGAEIEVRSLDLASLASVDALAHALNAEARTLDIVVLNAGIVSLGDKARHLTDDGMEAHFQTNFAAHALLVRGILPLLSRSRSRIGVQISLAANTRRNIWNDPQTAHGYTAMRAYGASKVALGAWSLELQRRAAAVGCGIRVDLSHPGVALTSIAPAMQKRRGSGVSRALIEHTFLGHTPAEAARPMLAAVTTDAAAPALFAPSGPWHLSGAPTPMHPFTAIADPAAGSRAWALVEEIGRTHAPRLLAEPEPA